MGGKLERLMKSKQSDWTGQTGKTGQTGVRIEIQV